MTTSSPLSAYGGSNTPIFSGLGGGGLTRQAKTSHDNSLSPLSLRDGGWSREDALRYSTILEQYPLSLPDRRTLYIDRMVRELPHKTRAEIVSVHISVLVCKWAGLTWCVEHWAGLTKQWVELSWVPLSCGFEFNKQFHCFHAQVRHETWHSAVSYYHVRRKAYLRSWVQHRGELLSKVAVVFAESQRAFEARELGKAEREQRQKYCQKLYGKVSGANMQPIQNNSC